MPCVVVVAVVVAVVVVAIAIVRLLFLLEQEVAYLLQVRIALTFTLEALEKNIARKLPSLPPSSFPRKFIYMLLAICCYLVDLFLLFLPLIFCIDLWAST